MITRVTSVQPKGLRTDIQALRAFAVLVVLLNHLWPEHLSGGFIGVDVFFVISGYLITAHLFREHERSGKIALGSFWARRAKRLLPAALLVLVVSAVLAYVFIPAPRNQNDFVQIGWAAMYVLNWVLSSQSLDYFAQEDGQTLVVHYWSLSVEEQFYIFWPILLAVAFLLMRSISKKKRTRFLVATILLVVVSSFTYAVWGVATRPEAVYFETTARAWEFGAGALLALVPSDSFGLDCLAWLGRKRTRPRWGVRSAWSRCADPGRLGRAHHRGW
jgi:peptidoglycan/LPS O-acetylase OafA/YrhL